MHSLSTFCQGFLCKMALAAGDSRPSRCWISVSGPSKFSTDAGLVAIPSLPPPRSRIPRRPKVVIAVHSQQVQGTFARQFAKFELSTRQAKLPRFKQVPSTTLSASRSGLQWWIVQGIRGQRIFNYYDG